MTSRSPAVRDRKPRLIGVDVARGLALLGMFATHVYGTLDDNDNPTLAHVVAGGRAATTFVVVAGVSLAFLSGGRRGVHGRELAGAKAGLAVRALLVGAIGLALGYLSDANGIYGILPFYALLFLLAIPLLGAAPMVLIGIAAAALALGPVLLVATADVGLPLAGADTDPTFTTLFQDPLGLLSQLFFTGEYPVVVYLAYLCVGLAIGRLDLRSRRVGWLLLGAGAVLAVASRVVSAVLLYPMGGLARLIEQDGLSTADVNGLLWETDESSSWWYLALPTPHSHTPIDLLHTMGCAVAVLGAMLLLTRIPVVARVLSPLAAAGAMSLTLYSAHLILLATGVLEDEPGLLFLSMVVGSVLLAWAWRWRFGQGPLEALVAKFATATRRKVARRTPPDGTTPSTARRGAQLLVPLACAGLLALSFWGGAQVAASGDTAIDTESSDVADVADVADGSVADLPDATADDLPDAAAPQPPPPVPAAGPADAGSSPAAADKAGDAARYCAVSDQLYTLDDSYPDRPDVVAAKGATQLAEMPQVAPAQIRDAVATVVQDYRAEAGVPGVAAPDDDTLTRAEATVEAFEDQNC